MQTATTIISEAYALDRQDFFAAFAPLRGNCGSGSKR